MQELFYSILNIWKSEWNKDCQAKLKIEALSPMKGHIETYLNVICSQCSDPRICDRYMQVQYNKVKIAE